MSLQDIPNREKVLCRSGFHTRQAFVGIRIPTYEQQTRELFVIEDKESTEVLF
jgi:hypothetical protein